MSYYVCSKCENSEPFVSKNPSERNRKGCQDLFWDGTFIFILRITCFKHNTYSIGLFHPQQHERVTSDVCKTRLVRFPISSLPPFHSAWPT